MYPSQAPWAQFRLDSAQAFRDLIRCFHAIHLHVDHADSHLDPRLNIAQGIQILDRPVRQFEYEVIDMQAIQEVDQRVPVSLLNSLPAVVPETEMDRARSFDPV